MTQNPNTECSEIEKAPPEELHGKLAPAELCAEGDPSIKIYEKENKSGTQKKGRGRPPKHGLSGTRTYRSFSEAKQRCTNSNNPDYPQYGGRGIEFRFQSVEELVADIGLRPVDKTLDRIDPNGHYEAGNVRWADDKQQANNRRLPSHQRQTNSLGWYQGRESRDRYMQAARHWRLSVAFANDHESLSAADASFLEERFAETSLPSYTRLPEPESREGFLSLPSLNHIGGRTVLRVRPGLRVSGDPLLKRGLLADAQNIPLERNCCQEELEIIKGFVDNVRSAQTGLIYCCNTSCSNNRIEGRLLATASRLAGCQQRARVVLAAEIASLLSADESEPLLAQEFLFMPDLGVWASVFGSDRQLTYRLRRVLEEREAERKPTIVYSDATLGEEFESLFACRFKNANLANVMPIHHVVPSTTAGGAVGSDMPASPL
jgi:hypothetical protein